MGAGLLAVPQRDRRARVRLPVDGGHVSVRRCNWPLWTPVGPKFTVRGLDWSATDLAFVGRSQFRPGEHLEVSMRLPIGVQMTRRGRVVWSEPASDGQREVVGVRFAGLPASLR